MPVWKARTAQEETLQAQIDKESSGEGGFAGTEAQTSEPEIRKEAGGPEVIIIRRLEETTNQGGTES